MRKDTEDIEELFDDDYPEDMDDIDDIDAEEDDETGEFAGSLSDMVSELEARLGDKSADDDDDMYEDDGDDYLDDDDLTDDDDYIDEVPEKAPARRPERKDSKKGSQNRRSYRSDEDDDDLLLESDRSDRRSRKIKALQDEEVEPDEEVDDYIAARRAKQRQKKPRYDMRKVAILAAALLLLVVLIVSGIRAIIKKGKGNSETPSQPTEVVNRDVEEEEQTEAEIPLELNAFNEINSLMQSYFHARTDANVTLLSGLVDNPSGISLQSLENRKQYVESYNNLNCYTHPGLYNDDKIVITSFQLRFRNINTSAPGLEYYYVVRNSEGNYVITTSQSDEVKAYIDKVQQGSEVQALISDTYTKLEEAENADPQLKELVELLRGKTSTDTGSTDSGSAAPQGVTKTANDSVRVRSSTDTSNTDNVLGVLNSGDTITVTGTEGDWSIVEYDGKTGYVKSEFLD